MFSLTRAALWALWGANHYGAVGWAVLGLQSITEWLRLERIPGDTWSKPPMQAGTPIMHQTGSHPRGYWICPEKVSQFSKTVPLDCSELCQFSNHLTGHSFVPHFLRLSMRMVWGMTHPSPQRHEPSYEPLQIPGYGCPHPDRKPSRHLHYVGCTNQVRKSSGCRTDVSAWLEVITEMKNINQPQICLLND